MQFDVLKKDLSLCPFLIIIYAEGVHNWKRYYLYT